MSTKTLKISSAGISYSCSSGGGGANAASSSTLYLDGQLYCACLPFSNIPVALGSTGAGSLSIKKATIHIYKASSGGSNHTTNALTIACSMDKAVEKSTSNWFGSSSVYGPKKSSTHSQSTKATFSAASSYPTSWSFDVTELIQYMCDTESYTSGACYIWFLPPKIASDSGKLLTTNNSSNDTYKPCIEIEYGPSVSEALITSVTSNVLLNNKVYVKFSPLFSTLWYKINITCGSISFISEWITYGPQYTEDEYEYLMSINKWAKAIPNSYSGTCRVTVSTYTDNVTSALLGSSSKTFTITLPSSTKPSVDLQTELVSGWESRYIQGESKCKLTVTGSAGTGSTLKSCSISGTGLTTSTSTTSPLRKTTSVLNKTGTLTYTAKVTDGRTTVSATESINVYPYSVPIINSFSARRKDETPTDVEIKYSAICSDIDGLNKITKLNIYKKLSTVSTWSSTPAKTISLSSSQQATKVSGTITMSDFASKDSYDFKIEAVDTRGKISSSAYSSILSEFRIVNINKKKNSLSIGKLVDTENLFDCAIPARFWNIVRFSSTEGVTDAGSLKTAQSNTGRNIICIQTGQNVDGGTTMGLAINNANVYVENEANSGKVNLGNGSHLWNQVYAANSTISTSDRRVKTDINGMSDVQEQLFNKLKPVTYKLKEGTSGRTHYGFISQDIEDSLNELGLTGKDFAGFCKDLRIDDDGNEVLDENGNKTYNYSLRYSEFIALNTYMIQKLQAENKELKSEIQELKDMISASSNNVE